MRTIYFYNNGGRAAVAVLHVMQNVQEADKCPLELEVATALANQGILDIDNHWVMDEYGYTLSSSELLGEDEYNKVRASNADS